MKAMDTKTSFSYTLTPPQQAQLEQLLAAGNYRPVAVPHTRIAVDAPGCRVNLYNSGKCLVQGKQAEEFVLFMLEPMVLRTAGVGYEDTLNPEGVTPHMGVDESGKGDVFGPLVIAAAYVNPALAEALRGLKVRDSKQISSDAQALALGAAIRRELGPNRFTLVRIGPETYNRLYAKIRNVNRLLAWAHARAIENLLERQPDCPRAVSDQFGAKHEVERALMKQGRKITLEQRHRAESDIAVAAASVLAREGFLRALLQLRDRHQGLVFPKGASPAVRQAAVALIRQTGDPAVLLQTAKCHFRTIDAVLAEAGATREALGADGQAVSKVFRPRPAKSPKTKAVAL